MKRVYCLYRVSTKGQVDGNDIPMQHIACHDFARMHDDWKIIREFYEKGISGYKVSADDRDAIQTIKADVTQGLFDILLVYMFDRLGRRDDETPFVVQWFVSQGIEVWSTIEGQQKFDNHVDKLLNYIRFWQASGESEKTSIRIKTRLSQMVMEGLYRGGTPPYGYRLVENGKMNKKGHPLHDLVVDPSEAAVINEIFYKMCLEGYGTHRLAKYLNNKYPKIDSTWRASTINRIICNTVYSGALRYNDTLYQMDTLQIINSEMFKQANYILHQRGIKNKKDRAVPQQTNGSKLLTGLLYCAHCGERLAGTVLKDNRKSKKTGEVLRKERHVYRCYAHDRFNNKCRGQSIYSAQRIDEAVLNVVNEVFAKLHAQPPENMLTSLHQNQISVASKKLDDINYEMTRLDKQRRNLREEVLKSINGEAVLDQKILNDLLNETDMKIASAKTMVLQEEATLAFLKDQRKALSDQQQKFLGWEAEFHNAGLSAKKMILSNIINKVIVDRAYTITVELNLSAKQFLEGI